jgi:hypothetical protein
MYRNHHTEMTNATNQNHNLKSHAESPSEIPKDAGVLCKNLNILRNFLYSCRQTRYMSTEILFYRTNRRLTRKSGRGEDGGTAGGLAKCSRVWPTAKKYSCSDGRNIHQCSQPPSGYAPIGTKYTHILSVLL